MERDLSEKNCFPSESEGEMGGAGFRMPSFRLDGRVAVVTGGGRGLGLGMALALAHAGADLVLASRTEAELEEAATAIRALGRRVLPVPTDVGQVVEVRRMVAAACQHFGGFDILVNAAGINVRRPVDTFTEEDWDRLMAVNLKGAFFACQAAHPVMRARGGGKILNVGSIAFEIAIPNIALYAISKGGMRQMTRALALEYAPDRIAVNAIAPGRFWTRMTDAFFSVPELYQSAVSVIPMGRPGTAADLAGATVLLASDASDYITGQTLYIDGGWLVNGGVKA
jgi:NAD(P)-dependent dehydrogenase (short-subunit alcohol dehydrogenase family)